MRVTLDRADRLEAVIRGRFIPLFCMIFGGLFAAIGIAALAAGEGQGAIFALVGGGLALLGLYFFLRRTQLVLDRTTNEATIRKLSPFGASQISIPLDAVAKAHVQRLREDGSKLYKLVLWVPGGPHKGQYSLTGGYSSGGWRKGKLARAINAWLGVAED